MGRISDAYGRRLVFAISCAGAAISYQIMTHGRHRHKAQTQTQTQTQTHKVTRTDSQQHANRMRISPLSCAVVYVATSLWMLFVARLIVGLCKQTTSTAHALIGDWSHVSQRATMLGNVNMT